MGGIYRSCSDISNPLCLQLGRWVNGYLFYYNDVEYNRYMIYSLYGIMTVHLTMGIKQACRGPLFQTSPLFRRAT